MRTPATSRPRATGSGRSARVPALLPPAIRGVEASGALASARTPATSRPMATGSGRSARVPAPLPAAIRGVAASGADFYLTYLEDMSEAPEALEDLSAALQARAGREAPSLRTVREVMEAIRGAVRVATKTMGLEPAEPEPGEEVAEAEGRYNEEGYRRRAGPH